MKKILLTFIAATLVLSSARADNSNAGETPEAVEATNVVELLSSVEGYVFITLGEERNLRNTFTRTEEVFQGETDTSLARMSWHVFNEKVATVDNDDGILYGKSYGNTLLRVTDADNTKHYFIVFVTPTITVVTPEGAVYTHQKIYNDKAHIKLSQSREYVINCVMRDGVDITPEDISLNNGAKGGFDNSKEDKITLHEGPDDGYGYGEYVSAREITSDVLLTVTLEDRKFNTEGQLYRSGIRVRVDGMKVSIVDAKGNPIGNEKVTITSVNGQVVYDEKLPESGVIVFNPDVTGVYFLSFDEIPAMGTFKFMTRNVQ